MSANKIPELKIPHKIVYEWMYKLGNGQSWHLAKRLMTSDEMASFLEDDELKPIRFKKTGREFIVEVDDETNNNSPQNDEK